MHSIAVHGGAGMIPSAELTPQVDAVFRAGLGAALRAGYAVLEGGGSSLDAVTAAVVALEEDALFNAGRGAVLCADGGHELDAAIMDGRDLRAGAVAGVRYVRNPVLLARRVMERSPHVMLAGPGADAFAAAEGLECVPNDWFTTERRRAEFERYRAGLAQVGDQASLGTVGAVALDAHGHLAAATSTGGMTGKRAGRVGDTPIIGAGTYAADDCCAVSATGHGEFFIRAAVAHEIASLVRYRGLDVQAAADDVVHRQLVRLGWSGGVISVGRDGSIAMPFNSPGMLRGAMDSSGRFETGVLKKVSDTFSGKGV